VTFLRFPELEARGLLHAFTLRSVPPLISADVPQILEEAGLPKDYGIGEQTHGVGVAVVNQGGNGKVISSVDALITRQKNLSLVIRVADCGPVWIHCEKTGAIGLVHSGRKGTEAGVVPATIRKMKEEFGSEPQEMMALLGPCIRPPYYDVDFASEILRQLKVEKVGKVADSGLCTAADLKRFYSYRAEKGQTGRHFALLAMRSAGA
jgi:copper oxidase (laccase) domain-containing protein